MVYMGKRACLGLEKRDFFKVTIVGVTEYKSWACMLSKTDLPKLLPKHVLSRGQEKEYNHQKALALYKGIYHHCFKKGAFRFHVCPISGTMSPVTDEEPLHAKTTKVAPKGKQTATPRIMKTIAKARKTHENARK
jgi:hypothetical protein